MFEKLYPDAVEESVFHIDFESLWLQGVRGVIFDIDNTLVPHGKGATDAVIRLFVKLKKMGMKTCLLSNNGKERVEMFNEIIKSPYIYKAGKPRRGSCLKAVEKMGVLPGQTVFVGDQIFTDIWAAKNDGLRSILVKPIHPKEEIQIVLKRYLEKLVLSEYKKKVEKRQELL